MRPHYFGDAVWKYRRTIRRPRSIPVPLGAQEASPSSLIRSGRLRVLCGLLLMYVDVPSIGMPDGCG
ncbi:MAG: hypothetical protein F9B45_30700 [Phycisphaera sp. RhM]|nr:hypothetical protein [Phycisphaera sp. RhM]